jgi:hypothetical protein
VLLSADGIDGHPAADRQRQTDDLALASPLYGWLAARRDAAGRQTAPAVDDN